MDPTQEHFSQMPKGTQKVWNVLKALGIQSTFLSKQIPGCPKPYLGQTRSAFALLWPDTHIQLCSLPAMQTNMFVATQVVNYIHDNIIEFICHLYAHLL